MSAGIKLFSFGGCQQEQRPTQSDTIPLFQKSPQIIEVHAALCGPPSRSTTLCYATESSIAPVYCDLCCWFALLISTVTPTHLLSAFNSALSAFLWLFVILPLMFSVQTAHQFA